VSVFAGTVPIIAATTPDIVMERYRQTESIDRLDVRSAVPTGNFASVAVINARTAGFVDTSVRSLVPRSANRDVRVFSRSAGPGIEDLFVLDANPVSPSGDPARASVELNGSVVELSLDPASPIGYVRVQAGVDESWIPVPGYAYGVQATAVGVEHPATNPADSGSAIEVHPNPVGPEATLSFSLPTTGPVHVGVYDILGRSVSRLADGVLEAGTHELRWLPGPVANGTYMARLTTTSGESIRKFVVAR
jgi:hypothetical protein